MHYFTTYINSSFRHLTFFTIVLPGVLVCFSGRKFVWRLLLFIPFICLIFLFSVCISLLACSPGSMIHFLFVPLVCVLGVFMLSNQHTSKSVFLSVNMGDSSILVTSSLTSLSRERESSWKLLIQTHCALLKFAEAYLTSVNVPKTNLWCAKTLLRLTEN